ncbi:MAG: FAD-dependent oxidoreductase [Elusimicrobiaceae bacterium]
MKEPIGMLTEAQLKAEAQKCEYCEEKACRNACPAHCSPADFLMAVKNCAPQDYKRAAALIMGHNPLGGVCGAVCPDYHCVKACSHKTFDCAVNIPAAQLTVIERARALGVMPEFRKAKLNGKKIAVIGSGPAGLGAAALLAQKGYKVDVFERTGSAGGMLNLIPDYRLDKKVLKNDIEFVKSLGAITVKTAVHSDAAKLAKKYSAVIVAGGQDAPLGMGIAGEENAVSWMAFLSAPEKFKVKGRQVAVIGGGAVAVDCAVTAKEKGAQSVELIYRRRLGDMPVTKREMAELLDSGANLSPRTTIVEILKDGSVSAVKLAPAKGEPEDSRKLVTIPGSNHTRHFDLVIMAIGAKTSAALKKAKGVFYAGDIVNGATSAVEAVAAGKNAALQADAYAMRKPAPKIEKAVKCQAGLEGEVKLPVSLEADFFGRKIKSPFLISAAPHSDGYEQVKKAYEAGWAGVVMKTSFDNVPIHIPGEYMFAFSQDTYANCDNVSGHQLDRVCAEVKKLVREFPDRLTMASTGGPVTGNDENDRKGWQSNTLKLEKAGAMGVEYSLSCPQGGDGTKGDIVSQDPELTAKIIGWVMEVSAPNVPKLFKLTGAVTSLYPILAAIKEVFAKYPNKKAGITLANSFPSMGFRHSDKKGWEEGVVLGMSGAGVTPISNLSLANAARHKMHISGNGGPMDYKAAADFLALGVETVQFCTIVMKYGYGIIDELESGLSHLMAERKIKSVKELVGFALPNPVTGFMELTPVKKISDCERALCQHCGNCTRCPYLAITLDENLTPVTDPAKCIGCSICVKKCFSGALFMRKRTAKETAALKEH